MKLLKSQHEKPWEVEGARIDHEWETEIDEDLFELSGAIKAAKRYLNLPREHVTELERAVTDLARERNR